MKLDVGRLDAVFDAPGGAAGRSVVDVRGEFGGYLFFGEHLLQGILHSLLEGSQPRGAIR